MEGIAGKDAFTTAMAYYDGVKLGKEVCVSCSVWGRGVEAFRFLFLLKVPYLDSCI